MGFSGPTPKLAWENNTVSHISEAEAIEQGYTIIKTAQDLVDLKDSVIGTLMANGKYILMGDIDLSGIDWSSKSLFGIDTDGIFDGNGYTIKGLNDTLFSNNYGTIKNLNIEVNITNMMSYQTTMGSLAINNNGTISNVHASGSITLMMIMIMVISADLSLLIEAALLNSLQPMLI